MEEIWKDIKDYEGLYEISNLGRVKSLPRAGTRTKQERILKPKIDNGYLRVNLCRNNKHKMFAIHRLTAEAFIPNKNHLPQVNHKDGNKLNNHISNLEWISASDNIKHAWAMGLKIPTNNFIETARKKGEKRRKKVLQYDLQGNFVKEWESLTEASKELNVSRKNISACCLKRYGRKTAGGYVWRFKKEVA